MGKPAARLGDSTAHGGAIAMGCPTVLIGGKPAARVGDMHTCPMQTPTPVPVPHVGGPILPPGAITVLIGGMPAACVGDMCTCVGPPDSIIPPGEVTVLIGPGGGGGGGGGGGSGGAGSSAAAIVGEAGEPGEMEDPDEEEDHYLDVKFTDKGGFPISGVACKLSKSGSEIETAPLTGRLRKTGLEPGSYDIELKAICAAKWSKDTAEIGQAVKMTATTSGVEPGTSARVTIFIRDFNSPDRPYQEFDTGVNGDKIEVEWEFAVDDEYLKFQEDKEQRGGYSMPVYYFTVELNGAKARSGLLRYQDHIELKLKDEKGNAIGGKKYRLFLPNGEVREDSLDPQGCAREEKIPPGKVRVSYDIRDSK